jgi:hypothetical protein
MRFLPLLALAACVAPAGDAREDTYDVEGELGNLPYWLVEAVPGDSYASRVTTCAPYEASPTRGCMAVYLLHVPAGTEAVVAVQPKSDFAPQLTIKTPDYTLVAHATEQTLYPHLPARAVFAIVGEGTYFVFLSGEGFASAGDFVIHFAALDEPLAYPLVTDSPTIGLVTDDLRDLDTRQHRDRLYETRDGRVAVGDVWGMPLAERIAVERLAAEINASRDQLFRLLARREDLGIDEATVQAIGREWVELRTVLDGLR